MKRSARLPRAMGIATRLAYAHGKANGIAMAPLLEEAGLSRRQIEDPNQPLRVADQVRFLNLVAEATGDDLLGLHLAKNCELREMGLYYYVLASSATIVEVCERSARFSSLLNEGAVQKFVDGRMFGVTVSYTGVSRHEDRQQVEFYFAGVLRMLRQLTGTHVVVHRLRMCHARSRGTREVAAYFGCPVEYGASTDEILFAKKVRQLPVVHSDPYLNRLLVRLCEEAVATRSVTRGTIRTQVENAIAVCLPHGSANATTIAKDLGLSTRSLARHLADEGVTYSRLLNGVRRSLADRYLEDGSLPIGQIAWLLGYQDIGAFSHAFKRWTGMTPREAAARSR